MRIHAHQSAYCVSRLRQFFGALLLAALACFPSGTARAQTFDDLVLKGDEASARFQSVDSLKYFLEAEKLDPKSASLMVRIAKQYRHVMSDAVKKEEKVKLGHTAVNYAQRAVALAPSDPETHLALAISYGKLTPYLSNKDQFANSPRLKAAVDRALALDPNNDLAWQVLGRWYLAVADVSGIKRALAKVAYGSMPAATYDDAVRAFDKAIALNPNRLMHHIEIGRTYVQMGRTADAKRSVLKGLSLPNTEKDDPATKERGREILGKLR